jgi:ComF family protein
MALLDLLLPPTCAGCGRYGAVLCEPCLRSLRAAGGPPDALGPDGFVRADPGMVVGESLRLACAAFVYEGPLRRALARLKYEGLHRLAGPIAAAAAPRLELLLASTGLQRDGLPLVPVPVHLGRLRERGYNQARLLADELGRYCSLPVHELLQRDRFTVRQHGLDRAGRLRNLAGAFVAMRLPRPPPAVVIVDDILTTSATLEACARVLQRAGVDNVYGFTIAREV